MEQFQSSFPNCSKYPEWGGTGIVTGWTFADLFLLDTWHTPFGSRPVGGKILWFIFYCMSFLYCQDLKGATYIKDWFLFLMTMSHFLFNLRLENISANLSSGHRFHHTPPAPEQLAACGDTAGNTAYWKHLYCTSNSEVCSFLRRRHWERMWFERKCSESLL